METVLITGANRGIGLELCRGYAARGAQVHAACRQATPALEDVAGVVHENVDVTDDRAVAALAAGLDGVAIDVLVNCAGVLTRESLDDLDFDRMRAQFEVNSLGPLRVTHALLPNLAAGSRVAIVTSRMGSIGDNTSGARYGYRMSKAAVNIAGVSLAHDLRDRGIAVVLLHPGMVATDMTGHQGIAPSEAARGLIERIDELSLATSGEFRHANGEALPW